MKRSLHNIIVFGAAICISSIILITRLSHKQSPSVRSVVFKDSTGWGYDILVNEKLFIHQQTIPVLSSIRAFPEKIQAEQTASLVIIKLKKGINPALNRSEIEEILQTKSLP